MKKRLATVLLLILCLCLTACGNSPEKLAQQYPELIGTWGSTLLSEAPLFTLRADGTCTYDQQDGEWKLNIRESNDTWRALTLILKDGTKVSYGFSYASFESVGERWIACPDDDYYELPIVNRDLYQRSQKISDAICGTWHAEGKNEPTLTLNADGTCVFEDQNGMWSETLESWDVHEPNYYRILTQMDDGKYITFSIRTKPYGISSNQFSKLYWQNQGSIDYMEGKEPNGTFNQLAARIVRDEDVEYIEITLDNVFDYFEQAESSWWEKDAFGDYASYQRQMVLRLKDEYLPRLCAGNSDIAVEFKMPVGYYKLEGILGSDDMTLVRDTQYEISDSVRQDKMDVNQMSDMDTAWFGSYIVGFSMSKESFDIGDSRSSYVESFEITRIAGRLCLTKE